MAMLERVSPHLAMIGIHKNGTWAAQKIMALRRARAHSMIQALAAHLSLAPSSFLGASHSQVLLPPPAPCTGMSDVDRSKGVLGNPESHTLGLPIVGGGGSGTLGAGMHA